MVEISLSDSTLGISLLILSLFCLGTWPALLRLSSFSPASTVHQRWTNGPDNYEAIASPLSNTEPSSTSQADDPLSIDFTHLALPRNVCHIYMDYSFAYLVTSSLPYLLITLSRPIRGVSEDVGSMSWSLIMVALLGGALLSCGNLSLQWATSVYHASLTIVLALQASMTVCLGTGVNFLLQPSRTPRPEWLIAAVTCFLVAIAFAVRAQLVYHPSTQVGDDQDDDGGEIELRRGGEGEATGERQPITNSDTPRKNDVTSRDATELPTNRDPSGTFGIVVAVLGGLAFGFFSPCFNVAVNDPFHWAAHQALSTQHATERVLRVNAVFALAFWFTSVAGNIILLKQQYTLRPFNSIVGDYVREAPFCGRRLPLSAGVVCALGNLFQFQGGQLVGFAASDLVQAYPLVSTVWDVVVFGEFRDMRCPSILCCMLSGMFASYLSGVLLFAGSSIDLIVIL